MPDLRDVTHVSFKNDGFIYINFKEYEAISTAWEEGRTYWNGEDEFGDLCVVKLTDITCIFQRRGTSRVAGLEEEAIRKKIENPII